MNIDWPNVRLGDHCLKIGSGATPKGGKEAYLDQGPFTLIRSQNVYSDGFSPTGLAYISEEQAKKLDGVSVEPGDVLLNITGDSVARVCSAPEEYLPARVNQHVAIIRPDKDIFNPKFVRYFLSSPYQQSMMLGLAAAGATRNALTKGMIEDFKIPCPSLAEQNEIAALLGSLDDRIALLRESNATLEAIAQAIFKSWLVDFDPVKAKIGGRRLEGLDEEVAALFPASFEESEYGLVPNGWASKGLDEIATYLNGLALQKHPPTGKNDLPVIKIAQLRKGDTVGADLASRAIKHEYIVNDGDVLFSWSGTLEVEIWCGGEGALNQHLFKVESSKYPKWFYYLWTKHHLQGFREIAANKATTMGHIQRAHLNDARAVVPTDEILKVADDVLAPIIEKIIANATLAKTLANFRDTLLPRLISGQLRFSGAKQMAGEII